MNHNLLHQIQGEGVSVWLDGVTRAQLRSGELARLVDELGVAGVTTNPTLFAASLADADAYAADVADVRARRLSPDEAARVLAAADVRTACDILLPLHEQTGRVGGWVSLEVNPAFADDLGATVAEVRALTWLVDRPNVMIKVPATPAGIAAIGVATAEGYNVNATLIFSAASYRGVLAAYTGGLEVARSAGLDLSTIHSVASLFVSRVDVALDATSAPAPDRHPFSLAGVANARRIHGLFQEAMATPVWQELLAAGANPQRPLWASTGVKDPALDPTTYVASLAIPGTVNTMPLATLMAALETSEQVLPDGSSAFEAAELHRALERLHAAGDGVMAGLLDDGVAAFRRSWDSVLSSLSTQLRTSRAGLPPSSRAEPPREVWLA